MQALDASEHAQRRAEDHAAAAEKDAEDAERARDAALEEVHRLKAELEAVCAHARKAPGPPRTHSAAPSACTTVQVNRQMVEKEELFSQMHVQMQTQIESLMRTRR